MLLLLPNIIIIIGYKENHENKVHNIEFDENNLLI